MRNGTLGSTAGAGDPPGPTIQALLIARPRLSRALWTSWSKMVVALVSESQFTAVVPQSGLTIAVVRRSRPRISSRAQLALAHARPIDCEGYFDQQSTSQPRPLQPPLIFPIRRQIRWLQCGLQCGSIPQSCVSNVQVIVPINVGPGQRTGPIFPA